MLPKERWLERWKSDYAFRTVVTALFSLLVTVLFALYNGFLGLYHGSVWYGTICLYYLLLALFRGSVIAAEKKTADRGGDERSRDRAHLAASVLLLILNISMIGPITLMVTQQKPVDMTLIPAIVMAVYTTYKITMASVHLRRSRELVSSLVRLLRTINFIDALVSILTLQNTLIMVTSKGDGMRMLPLSAVSSALILAEALYVSAVSICHGIRRLRRAPKAQ
ncbi:MAG: hypothetical protein IJR97_09420 [Clostridia bacterium]|nr:hypothetical protein [Clostridia bacterium]